MIFLFGTSTLDEHPLHFLGGSHGSTAHGGPSGRRSHPPRPSPAGRFPRHHSAPQPHPALKHSHLGAPWQLLPPMITANLQLQVALSSEPGLKQMQLLLDNLTIHQRKSLVDELQYLRCRWICRGSTAIHPFTLKRAWFQWRLWSKSLSKLANWVYLFSLCTSGSLFTEDQRPANRRNSNRANTCCYCVTNHSCFGIPFP